MIPYITYREPDADGNMLYFILQKDFPHFLCEVSERPIVNFFQPVPINEYNLYIIFNATLRGNVIPSYQQIGEEIKAVMHDMATWFYNERIIPNEKKYKKWKQHQIAS